MNHEVRIDIDAPAEIVWATLIDVGRWPEWTASVRSVELLDSALAPGARVRIRQPKFPPLVWTVTDFEPGTSFAWQTRSPGSDAVARHTVIDNGDRTSAAVLSVTQTGVIGTVVAFGVRPLTKRYVALEAAGLKQRSEDTAHGR